MEYLNIGGRTLVFDRDRGCDIVVDTFGIITEVDRPQSFRLHPDRRPVTVTWDQEQGMLYKAPPETKILVDGKKEARLEGHAATSVRMQDSLTGLGI